VKRKRGEAEAKSRRSPAAARHHARPRRDPLASLNFLFSPPLSLSLSLSFFSSFFPLFLILRSLQITSKSSIVFVRNIPLKVTRDTSRKHSTVGETCLLAFPLLRAREKRGSAMTRTTARIAETSEMAPPRSLVRDGRVTLTNSLSSDPRAEMREARQVVRITTTRLSTRRSRLLRIQNTEFEISHVVLPFRSRSRQCRPLSV